LYKCVGNNNVGGIVGYVDRLSSGNTLSTITDNSNFGVVIGEEDTGCIVGRRIGGIITNNHYDKQMCGE
jgi:hypothetical protein